MSFTLHGLGVSGGIAIGRAMLMSHATLEVSHLTIAPRMVDKEIARFEAAIKAVKSELETMKETTEHAPAELAAFIDIHTMFLEDPELVDKPREIIRERRCNAEWALVQQMEDIVEQFEQFEDPYLRERKFDVVQVVERVIKELLGHPGRAVMKTAKGVIEEMLIVVAHDLSPADVIAFKDHRFASFITDVGGSTSHTAILARSLAIPSVVGMESARSLIRDGEQLIVDGKRGVVIVNPDIRVLEEYQLRKHQIELERSKLKRLKSTSSCSPTSNCRATCPGRSKPAPRASACSAPNSSSSTAVTCPTSRSSTKPTRRWSRAWPGARSPSAPSTSAMTKTFAPTTTSAIASRPIRPSGAAPSACR